MKTGPKERKGIEISPEQAAECRVGRSDIGCLPTGDIVHMTHMYARDGEAVRLEKEKRAGWQGKRSASVGLCTSRHVFSQRTRTRARNHTAPSRRMSVGGAFYWSFLPGLKFAR